MTITEMLPVVCGLGAGVGVVGLASSWRSDEGRPTTRRWKTTGSTAAGRRDVPLLVASVVGGALAFLATGWPVAFPIAGVAIYGLPKLFGRTSGSSEITKIEAIASWTEMLQGTLSASAGLGQAIIATAPLAPVPIRDPATRLAARLTSGMQPRDALLQFADELRDPSADRVVCALVMAAASRAQRLGDLLSALADSTRDEVALRLRIETSRASVRSGVRTVLVFSVGFAVALVVLAHTYLAPFGSSQGQLVLAFVGALYAVGLTSMVSLSRPPAPVRLLGSEVVAR
jgi:tight adherence protein B